MPAKKVSPTAKRYSAQVKANAVRLGMLVGPKRAGKELGIPMQRISVWVGEHQKEQARKLAAGELAPEPIQEAGEYDQPARLDLIDKMIARVDHAVVQKSDAINMPLAAADAKNFAVALGVLLDKRKNHESGAAGAGDPFGDDDDFDDDEEVGSGDKVGTVTELVPQRRRKRTQHPSEGE